LDPKSNFSGIVKKSVTVNSSKEKIWEKISNVGALSWVIDVQKTILTSKTKRGLWTVREITFNDASMVEEIIVGWKKNEYFSYIAINGLPLRAYHATISMKRLKKNTFRITWQSFFNSIKISKKEFSEFSSFMNSFYSDSLTNLKMSLER